MNVETQYFVVMEDSTFVTLILLLFPQYTVSSTKSQYQITLTPHDLVLSLTDRYQFYMYHLTQNLILVICKEIGSLLKLKYLCLGANRIEKICEEIGNLKLWYFELHKNNVSKFTYEMIESIAKIRNLRSVCFLRSEYVYVGKFVKKFRDLKYVTSYLNDSFESIYEEPKNIYDLYLIE